jgi:predicted ATPase
MATVHEKRESEHLDRSASPFLRRVRIRGYRSIAFCDVALAPLTVLVGRNAAGKSNFLDALAFLSDLLDKRATEAVNERRGWRSIHCRDGDSPCIEMGFEATFESFQSTWDAEYAFALELSGQNLIRVREENLILNQHGKDRRCGYRMAADGKVDWIGEEHFAEQSGPAGRENGLSSLSATRLPNPGWFTRRGYDRLLLSLIGTQPFVDLAERLRASCVYSFSPPAMRELQPMTASPILVRDGRNLARAIEELREIEPQTVERIVAYLSAIVPDILGFQVVEYGDFETVRFSLKKTHGEKLPEFDAASMSDGTLRTLAALVAAFQVVLPGGFPGFIGIEEPETALHPAAMRALVDALDEATGRTQVLLSTHSADLLDNPTISPDSLRVVEISEGRTVITPLDEASQEIVRRKLNTPGELERQDRLETNLDDLERQQQLSHSSQVRQNRGRPGVRREDGSCPVQDALPVLRQTVPRAGNSCPAAPRS